MSIIPIFRIYVVLNIMTIEELKSASLISYLSVHNHPVIKRHGEKIWYLSPLHEEKNASFKVNANTNLWYDFGLNRGGNIITLVKELNPALSMHQVLKLLEEEIRTYGLLTDGPVNTCEIDYKRIPYDTNSAISDDTTIECLIPIRNYHLKQYLSMRRIDISVAEEFCKEVHYKLHHTTKSYYGIAFENVDSGMEVRNKFFKRCIGRKTYSYIHSGLVGKADECCIFEGFFDFLTYMTFRKRKDSMLCIDVDTDYIILNSVAVVRKTFDVLRSYNQIHCFLDNDRAGKEATDMIAMAFPGTTVDESYRYSGYKDLNDVILGNIMK